jgi:SAM-dependent methyltransferase
MDQGEVLRTPEDKHIGHLPREGHARRTGNKDPKRAILWGVRLVKDFGPAPAIWGKLPKTFLPWAYEVLRVPDSRNVLHVCSGGLDHATHGVRVDIRCEVLPDVVADGRALPFADDSFDAILIDPPYSVEYAESLYQTDYPRPSALLREASRVLRPGRRVGFVHFLVPRPEADLSFVEVHGITTGCGYRIRAMTVFAKAPRGLFDHPPEQDTKL